MALKTYKPVTPSLRELVLVDRSELWKGKPVKRLTEGLSKSGGRNNHGRITAPHRGGGHKRRYRLIDFKRQKLGIAATVERLEYDPNRSAFIALIRYEDGELAYILAPQRLKAGDPVIADARVDVKPGNAAPLRNIPMGTILHNVELKPGKGGQLARSAGTYVQLVGRDGDYAQLRPAGCAPSAWPRSARCPTRTTRTSTTARPGACAGWAGGRTSVAWR
ncbi:MAG: ribosomal protein [Geminicoccaceae bacterium]|nr:ribosomal protein [Geminicoccaceae bacterium]